MNFYFVPNENARFRREESYCFLVYGSIDNLFHLKAALNIFTNFQVGPKIDALMNSTYSNFYFTYSLKQNLKQ